MRYADDGGLTVQARSRREQVRLRAAEMFAQDVDAWEIARSLRVSTGSRAEAVRWALARIRKRPAFG
jgi:hypothetical protein